MNKLTLRPLQQKTIDMVSQAFRQGHKKILIYGPTGFGKTECAIALMNATKNNRKRSGMILDRIVLCDQTSQRLEKYSIDHGVLQSGHFRYRPYEDIQVCSAQTLEARGTLPDMSLMIVDEAHCQRKFTTEYINNSDIYVIGLSASPFTKGIGNNYDHVISCTTTKELVDQGWLVPLKVYIAKEIDMKGAKKVAGEWTTKEATNRGKLIVGDVVNEWIEKTHEHFGKPEKTIVFSAGVDHGEMLAEEFRSHGYNFINISYKDDDELKKQVLEDFSRPDTTIHGVIATDILTKGFDCSDVRIGISTRPFSKSFSSHVQQLGRVMRQHDGKDYALWLDHAGNYLRFLNDWNDLYQNGVRSLDDSKEKPKTEPTERIKEAAKCPRCSALWEGGDTCHSCGYKRPNRNEIVNVPGELKELQEGQSAPKEKHSMEYKQEFYSRLLGYAKERGFKDGFAYHAYHDKFSCYPANTLNRVAKPPNTEIRNWITHRAIRRAKGKAA